MIKCTTNSLKDKIKLLLSNNLIYYPSLIVLGLIWGIGQYPNFFFIRFFGFLPLIYIILYRKHYLWESLLLAWAGYIANFYWLATTFIESGKLPVVIGILIPILFCLTYALSYPAFAFIMKKFLKFNKKLIYILPFVYVFIDFLFPRLFTHTISDSMINFYYFIQLIDITGMSGLTLIIMFFNVGLYILIERIITRQRIKLTNFLFVLPFLLALGYGVFRANYLERLIPKAESVKASMIQGNISGKEKLDEKYFKMNMERYNSLSLKAIHDSSPDILIWPESVFNRAYNYHDGSFLKDKIQFNEPPLFLGIVVNNNGKFFNTAILVRNKQHIAKYEKKHLLAFGEYVPFEKPFPFLRKLTPLPLNTSKGQSPSIINIGNIKACLSICFEDIFADEIRKKNNKGSNIMINITNDSWFGKNLGPKHHSILARLRAIENRRSFFRCTATGYTTASDFCGRIKKAGKMSKDTIVTATLPLYSARSIYSYIGELVSYLSIAIVLIIIIYVLFKYFTSNRQILEDDRKKRVVFRERFPTRLLPAKRKKKRHYSR